MVLLTASLNYRYWIFVGRYVNKLFMACGYNVEQQLLSLVFVVVEGEESVANWGWFMQWLHKEVCRSW
jgi:hypothetical protein